jgi:hypothetical protein
MRRATIFTTAIFPRVAGLPHAPRDIMQRGGTGIRIYTVYIFLKMYIYPTMDMSMKIICCPRRPAPTAQPEACTNTQIAASNALIVTWWAADTVSSEVCWLGLSRPA